MINKKQILVIALVLVIITAGILQYSYGKSGFTTKKESDERLGEAVYVGSMEGELIQLTDGDDEASAAKNQKEQAGKETDDYFAQARLDRESIRSRQKEELNTISSSENAKEVAVKAQEEYLDLIKRSDIEATIESLVKQRGIEDVVAIFGVNGSVDLIVKADSLSQDQTAQISDIVIRHAGVEMTDIHIKNMK